MNTKYKTPILLIEDNPGDVELIKIYLEDAAIKHELFHQETLYEGLNFIQHTPIDLVLLDLNLPDSSGFKTLTSFLERAPKVPVIVLTGTNNEIIGNQAVKAGAQDFLIKSQFDGKLLGRVVRYSLQRGKVQLKLEETARELELNKKRFLEAQEMAHFGTWQMDLVTNEMKWAPEVYRIFGFQPGSLQTNLATYLGYVHLEDRHAVEAFFEKATKDGRLHQMEHRIVLDGANIRYVTVYAKVQAEESSGKILLVGGLQDITERKLSEKLMMEKNISNKAARMQEEAISELSFQVRTPLSSMVNLLFLLENENLSPQQEGLIDELKTSLDDLSISINNLLNFSVMVADSMKADEEEFILRDFMQGAEKVVKLKADTAKVNLKFKVDEKLPEKIITDPKKLTQILYNLIDNAIRYSGEGSNITVSAGLGESQGNRATLRLVVSDTGEGMPKSQVKELREAGLLIEPAVLEKDKKQPLGVAIVNKLVKVLGGEIDIQSKEKAGSTFTVKVPVRIARQARFIAGDAPDMPLRILLVEDHFLNQIATKKVLQSWSDLVLVDIAENGQVALEKFRENDYDLVLMDIQMPVMNGFEAAKKIRQFSNVPIIALTANSTKQEQDKCIEIGMNDYLAKPFKPQELYSKIMNLMSLVLN